MTWLDGKSEKQLREAFIKWREAKKEINEPPTLSFGEWLIRETNISKKYP